MQVKPIVSVVICPVKCVLDFAVVNSVNSVSEKLYLIFFCYFTPYRSHFSLQLT
jgi:hypothetical protein